jgi:hypothetical protein
MMETAAFIEYLDKRYKGQLEHYSAASRKNKKRYNNFQWILIILSTLTTILAALPPIKIKGTEINLLQYVVVVTAGLVAILTAGLKTFKYEELWVNHRSTTEQLKPEIYKYQFNVGGYGIPGVDKETLFVSEVEEILAKEHDSWPMYKKLKDQDKQKDQPLDDLQKKLDDLLREKFNTQKTTQPVETTVTDQPEINTETEQTTEPAADTAQPEETTEAGQVDETTDAEQAGEPAEKEVDDAGEETGEDTAGDEGIKKK